MYLYTCFWVKLHTYIYIYIMFKCDQQFRSGNSLASSQPKLRRRSLSEVSAIHFGKGPALQCNST